MSRDPAAPMNRSRIAVNPTRIGDRSRIGAGSILAAPVVVGRGAVVGANAIVTHGHDFTDGHTLVGVPARPMETILRCESLPERDRQDKL